MMQNDVTGRSGVESESPAVQRLRAILMEGRDIGEQFCELLQTGALYRSDPSNAGLLGNRSSE
jgi:hypothetical protein